ncbi:MAG: restriction endonuclease subunit R [Prochlorothrix sp.]|nr:restriction endonuclease subunit R [Prochlorothrix sp.]
MTQVISPSSLTLLDLHDRFHLTKVQDPGFFPEWQGELPELSREEAQRLQRVEAAVSNLESRAFLENTVKLAVLAPLLDLAGFFFPPFYVSTEEAIELHCEDEGQVMRGRIDILVLMERLWVLVIESKRAEFSVKVGIPQVLAYMLANTGADRPLYGLVSNGTDFVFVKLVRSGAVPCYGVSRRFVLGQGEDLAGVLGVLKGLAAGAVQDDRPNGD